MTRTRWMVGTAAAVCVIGVSLLPSLADACHGQMMHGQMHSGHGQGEHEEHGGHYLKHLLKHAKEIGLTSGQVSKLKAMQLDLSRELVREEADVKVAKLELHALLEDEQAELSTIQAKVGQLKKAEGALLLSGIRGRREAMALLTPEQREKDQAQRERMKSEGERQHGGGMGGMGRGGMGGMGMGHGGMGGDGHSGRRGMEGGSQGEQGGSDHGSGDASGGQPHQH